MLRMAGGPSPSLGLPRSRRIKQGRDFARVKSEGKRLAQGCLVMNWLASPAGTGARLGVITGRRLGNAVARSRARRLLREAFRLHQRDLPQPLEVVLVARPSIVGKQFGEVESDFLTALRKAGLLRPADAAGRVSD
jgi:ribonuclease P protein component